MSGCYNGLQAHIKRINHLALRSLCSALTEWLEYVQRKAALEQSHSSDWALYNFFSASTHRWAIMLKHLEKRELFDDYETKANEKTDTQYSDENQRVRKGKDITMTELQKKLCSEEKKLKVDTYLPVLDMLCTELSRRLEAYREINNLFGFLTDFSTKSDAEIRQACTKFKEQRTLSLSL
ncbi:hypothetical protein EVAR_71194_1 [Eumeta japonica]|uniref:Uncharacterized protein n=1 Tax=Eumeta variegata TaxID=151549 RepID=A0A4C2A464_EUMVA|nr:hypothetical protein EVAR_71194_1 [Eumeta japonica]